MTTPFGEAVASVVDQADRLSVRRHPIQLRRQWVSVRLRETPAWLLSLITHMTLLVIIGALATTYRARVPVSPIVLTLSGIDESEDTSGVPEVFVLQDETRREGGEDGTRTAMESGEDEKIADVESLQPEANASHTTLNPLSQETVQVSFDVKGIANLVVPDATDAVLPIASSRTPTPEPTNDSNSTPRRVAKVAMTQQRMDQIVDRFIQFDIGRLRGRDRVMAVREFQQLGPEAIPALVRGLNKSAAIRASCPIGVITGRLNRALHQTNDPSLIRYALENIGRGVDPTDPHYDSIQGLALRWKKLFGKYVEPAGPRSLAQKEFADSWASTRWPPSANGGRAGETKQIAARSPSASPAGFPDFSGGSDALRKSRDKQNGLQAYRSAQQLEAHGRNDEAIVSYRALISLYPASEVSAKARQRLRILRSRQDARGF